MVRHPVNILRLVLSLVSFLAFCCCFYYVAPVEPSIDAVRRFLRSSNPDYYFTKYVLFNEPLQLVVGYFSSSPLALLITYSLIATFICYKLLRIPMCVLGLFILTPPGYLLTFNITPSFIAFCVVNFSLTYNARLPLVLFGLINHLVAALSVARMALKIFWLPFHTKLLIAVVLLGVYAFLEDLVLAKLRVYGVVDGNFYHSFAGILFSLIILASRVQKFTFAATIYALVISLSMAISTKISSRLAFGADLLFVQFCVVCGESILLKMYKKF